MKKPNHHTPPQQGPVSPGEAAHALPLWELLALIGVVAAVALLRYRLLTVPLERDEGGFAYMGKLLLQGVAPYTEAYDFKPPGLYGLYALFMALFGAGARGIHMGLLVMDCGTVILVYTLMRRRADAYGALTAALLAGIMMLSPSVLGFAAHATHFVIFFALGGFLLLDIGNERDSLLSYGAAGILFAVAALMKQPGAVFVLFGLAAIALQDRQKTARLSVQSRRFFVFAFGAAVPLALTVLWLSMAGALRHFLYWNFTYGTEFGTQLGLTDAPEQLQSALPFAAGQFLPLWIVGALGTLALLFIPSLRRRHADVILFAAASAIAVSAGFQFRSHYFILGLPALAMAVVIGLPPLLRVVTRGWRDRQARILTLAIPLALLLFGMVSEHEYFFSSDPDYVSRSIYFPNPFVEAKNVGAFLNAHTSPDDRIGILGSEPEILMAADRRSATPYLYMYFFMEVHDSSLAMQKEFCADLEHASPKYVVYVTQQPSWSVRPTSENYVFRWSSTFLREHYALAGLVDIVSPTSTVFRWGEDALNYPRGQSAAMLIFQRR